MYSKAWKTQTIFEKFGPKSLLNVIYELASGCIVERIKTWFLKGRFIGETIRLIYDLMNYTEVNQIPGLLMLIDFEKAFDSISWDFIFQTLDLFNFGNSIKDWIKTFYSGI